jgi:hypothetical protein
MIAFYSYPFVLIALIDNIMQKTYSIRIQLSFFGYRVLWSLKIFSDWL